MARKGQTFKKYSNKLKSEVVSKVLEGRGYKSIGRDYPDIPVHTYAIASDKIIYSFPWYKKSVLRCATTKRMGLRSPFRLSGGYILHIPIHLYSTK